MSEYEMRVLIDELGKLIVSKNCTISNKDYEIEQLKKRVEHLEHLLTPKAEKVED